MVNASCQINVPVYVKGEEIKNIAKSLVDLTAKNRFRILYTSTGFCSNRMRFLELEIVGLVLKELWMNMMILYLVIWSFTKLITSLEILSTSL